MAQSVKLADDVMAAVRREAEEDWSPVPRGCRSCMLARSSGDVFPIR